MIELHHTKLNSGSVSYRLIGKGSRKILFFHGFPGSSSQIALFQDSLKEQDLQVLCYDRPGYNKSFVATQDMLSITMTVANELTSQLGWTKFEVVTVSGGTPYGISYATYFPDKVSAVRVICGMGYIQNPDIKKHFKGLKLFSLQNLRYIPGTFLKKVVSPKNKKNHSNKRSRFFEFFYPTSAPDRDVLIERSLGNKLAFTIIEAVSQNAAGPIADSQVFLSNWGKELHRLTVPIQFWHGDQDLVISSEVSRVMADLIPHSRFHLVANEGHLSLPIRRAGEILSVPL